MGFTVFAFNNTVTGIFVDQAMRASEEDHRNVMLEERDQRDNMLAEVRQAFHIASAGKNYINRKMMVKATSENGVKKFLKRFDIDARDMLAFFDLVSYRDHAISLASIDAFINSCVRARGFAMNAEV